MTMAEPRRVPISSAPSNVSIQPPSPKKPRINHQDAEMSVAATVRIALTLFEPNQKKCPEFFYPELLRNLQGNHKKAAEKAPKTQFNPFSHEEAERKEVEALSKKFEEKYGKKRRRDRMQDLIDMGYGYDESDSFIDNSEAYDELVPASLNTKYGGFYINSGTLQFRQASESEDESVREKKKKSPKKIKERGDKVKKRKKNEDKKSKKSKYSKSGFTALNGTKDKMKKRMLVNLHEMLAKFEKDKKTFEKWTTSIAATTTTAPKMSSSTPTAPVLPPPPPREAEPAPDPLLTATVSESELVQAVNAMESLTGKELDKLDVPPEKTGVTVKEEFKKPPSVPEGLPPSLEKKIKEFAKWVQTPDGDKKVKLYSPQMNAALLDLYLLCRDLSSSLRSSVFSHLSSILPCSKEALVKWANRLYLVKQGEQLREPLRKLKEAVGKAMPEQIVKYHAELKVYNQAKYAKMLSEDKDKDRKTPSEEEEEEDKGSKKAAGPRKKFQWTEEIRQLLCHLVRMKVDMYEPEVMGTPSLEDYLKCFLDEEVKPLWPRGWMQARTLFKESRRLYPQLSSMMAKNKTVNPPKIKAKESFNRLEKNVPSSSMESQVSAVTRPASAKDSPPSVASSSGGSPVSAHTQDNSLDGDLIHNPPSLEGVSEHLSALSGRSSGLVFEFPVPSKSSVPEKPIMVEEKKKPCPPISVPGSLQAAARPVFNKKFIVTNSEKKVASPLPSPKPLSETQQKQPSPHQPVKTAHPSVQPTMSLYQIGNKGSFTHPIQSGGAKVTAPSQQPPTPQTKPLKPQAIPPSSSTTHKPIASPGFIVKPPSNSIPSGVQIYRGPVSRMPATPHGNLGNNSGQNATMTVNPPTSSGNRNPATMSTKKSTRPPQKLTLMAPQDSGKGTQGVAKLLTSSMVAAAGGNAASNINKGNVAPGLLGTAPLTILTSSYKQNGGKMPAPTSLSLLSPISNFPLHVVSFTTEPSPKAGASKDAIVTGPAPGTFNHGLPRNILGGLRTSTGHHSSPIPHPALSGHIQPAQTDGAHTHSKGTVPSQMRTSRPNNP
ncbi:ubinuclein-1 [Hyla sarda]|uniref:ubinuclein-1 n=1 Tax=Hyla sarda TaxID=327740 RepID=UPI0024C223D1|nr:ubinuclein-1 [Hyla sarda]XP_056393097.1 ubinuclein-1 [Hyla sarda]